MAVLWCIVRTSNRVAHIKYRKILQQIQFRSSDSRVYYRPIPRIIPTSSRWCLKSSQRVYTYAQVYTHLSIIHWTTENQPKTYIVKTVQRRPHRRYLSFQLNCLVRVKLLLQLQTTYITHDDPRLHMIWVALWHRRQTTGSKLLLYLIDNRRIPVWNASKLDYRHKDHRRFLANEPKSPLGWSRSTIYRRALTCLT